MNPLPQSPKPFAVERERPDTSLSDFVLDSYLMHIHPTRCTFCNRRSARSEIHEVHIHRTRIGLSGLRRLLPARQLSPDYPLATIRFPSTDIPACHACVDYLPLAGALTSTSRLASESAWAETLRRKHSHTVTPPTHIARRSEPSPSRSNDITRTAHRRAPTLDQL